MRSLLTAALCSAALAYVLFSGLGVLLSPALDTPLSEASAADALAFSFPDQGEHWVEPSGAVAHTWLHRQAYVEGFAVERNVDQRYTEQVLKVGWPFTVVRGFIRSTGTASARTGVAWAAPAEAPVRLLPMQPVWPGVVFYGLVGLLMAYAVSRAQGRSPRARLSPQ